MGPSNHRLFAEAFTCKKARTQATSTAPRLLGGPAMGGVATWILFAVLGVGVAACQTPSGSMGLPAPASREACADKARQEVADTGQRSSDLQKDRYFVYRACMHAAGLRP